MVLAKKSPENYGVKPFGEMPVPAGGKAAAEYEWSVGEAFSRWAIWAAILTFLTSMMGEFLIWTQVVSYWVQDLNWPRDTAVGVYAIIGLVGIFSMPIMGIVADKVVKAVGNEVKGRKIMLVIGPAHRRGRMYPPALFRPLHGVRLHRLRDLCRILGDCAGWRRRIHRGDLRPQDAG